MSYHDPRLHHDRLRRAATPGARRFDPGPYPVEFHIDGCTCDHCSDAIASRLDAYHLFALGVLGFALGAVVAFAVSFAAAPGATIAAALAVAGVGL